MGRDLSGATASAGSEGQMIDIILVAGMGAVVFLCGFGVGYLYGTESLR